MRTDNFESMMNRTSEIINHVVKIAEDASLPVRQRLFTLRLLDEVLKSKTRLLNLELAAIEEQEMEEHRKTCPRCSSLHAPTPEPPQAA